MEPVRFEDLGVDERILRAVTEMGFEEATPIQAKAIPEVMTGQDIIGQAQTGTGKTASFGIPMLQKVDPKNKHVQAIVLCPTRELAIQSADEIRKLAKFMHGIKVTADLWRTGYCEADPLSEDRCSGADRYAGTCHGPYETPYD